MGAGYMGHGRAVLHKIQVGGGNRGAVAKRGAEGTGLGPGLEAAVCAPPRRTGSTRPDQGRGGRRQVSGTNGAQGQLDNGQGMMGRGVEEGRGSGKLSAYM